MSIGVRDVRLSVLWYENDPELLGEDAPTGELAFLRRAVTWLPRFESVKAYADDPDELTPPWPRHRGKHFWNLYLGQDPHDISAREAWNRSVPLRWRPPVEIAVDDLPVRFDAEGFFFPFGRAFILTARLSSPRGEAALTLDETVEACLAIRREGSLRATWSGGHQEELTAPALAGKVLTLLRERARGAHAGAPYVAPFSTTTFVRVEGADPASPIPAGEQLHRALTTLTRWPSRTTWKIAAVPSSLDDALPDVDDIPGHLHLTHRHGHVAWLPAVATRQLTCFHRNQSLASLQVEALGGLTRTTANRPGRHLLPAEHDRLARKVAGLLGRIYGGDPGTYRSLVCRSQLVDRGYHTDLEALRAEFGMTPLH